jgi:hypothetical protein
MQNSYEFLNLTKNYTALPLDPKIDETIKAEMSGRNRHQIAASVRRATKILTTNLD